MHRLTLYPDCDAIEYGRQDWPSRCAWIIPGTEFDPDRIA
jgi:hypothetical protein